mgnify:CR=1 FL=1
MENKNEIIIINENFFFFHCWIITTQADLINDDQIKSETKKKIDDNCGFGKKV